MSGTIIEIRRHRGFRPAKAARQHSLEQQIARITALLDELDELNGGGEAVPAWLAGQAEATLSRARLSLRPAADESDPQPQVDREALERMYRSLEPPR